jgi:hypothetical protein
LSQPTTGIVVDGNGVAVAGATVTITDESTGLKRSATTDAEGAYTVADLPPGSYRVVVDAQGFKRAELHNVIVEPGRLANAPATISVNPSVGSATVIPIAPALDPDASHTSVNYESGKIKDLPSLAPVESFARLATGVSLERINGPAGKSLGPYRAGDFYFRLNGGRPQSTNYSLDSMDNNDTDGRPVISIDNFDAADSLQVLTTRAPGDLSLTGASSINLITRAGTNDFHGTVFDYHLTRSLGTLSPLERRSGLKQPPIFKNTIYGATLGGPAVRDRIFFFGAFQGESEASRRFNDSTASFLTPTERGLAHLARRFSDSRGVADLIARGPLARDSAEAQVTRTFLIPVLGVPIEFEEVVRLTPSTAKGYEAAARLYLNVTPRDTIKASYWYDSRSATGVIGRASAGYPGDTEARAQLGSLRWNRTLSPRSSNELGFGLTRSRAEIAATLIEASAPVAPSVIAGFRVLPYGTSPLLPASQSSTLLRASDLLTHISGRHNIKLGGQARRRAVGFDYLPGRTAQYSFVSFEDFVEDRPAALAVGAGDRRSRFTETHLHLFIDDAWRVWRNLTLSFGLSYENAANPINDLAARLRRRESDPSSALFDTSLPLEARTIASVSRDNNNFAPRFGLAYTPQFRPFGWNIFGYDKTVIRGGASLAYDQTSYRPLAEVAASAPSVLLGVITPAVDQTFPLFPDVPGGDELSSLLGKDPARMARTQLARNFKTPASVAWHLAASRDFDDKLVIELGYAGARGSRLIRAVDGNPFDLTASGAVASGPLRLYETSGRSIYHSLQASADLRLTDRLTGGLTYTLSKLIDNVADHAGYVGGGVGAPASLTATRLPLFAQNPFDNDRGERAISSINRKHSLAGHFIYSLPLRRDQSGVTGRLLGGWQASGIVSLASGAAFTPLQQIGYSPQTAALFASAFSDRLGSIRPFNANPAAPTEAVAFSNAANQFFRFFLAPDGTPFSSPTGFIIADRSGFRAGAINEARFIYNDFAVEQAARARGLAPDAFGQTYAAGRPFGDVGRNTLIGPELANLDFALVKMTKLSEKVSLQFRSEFFNLFNHPSRTAPSFILENAGGFGFADLGETDAAPRHVRLALKLIF